jgi:hypothetical protein
VRGAISARRLGGVACSVASARELYSGPQVWGLVIISSRGGDVTPTIAYPGQPAEIIWPRYVIRASLAACPVWPAQCRLQLRRAGGLGD